MESRYKLPGPESWLLAHRSIADPVGIAHSLSNASQSSPLQTMAEVAAARWSIETAIEERKGENGRDEYEVRNWHSWHRHITLSMMAFAWQASIREAEGKNQPDPELAELSVLEVCRLL